MVNLGCDECEKDLKWDYKSPNYICLTINGLDYHFCSKKCLVKHINRQKKRWKK